MYIMDSGLEIIIGPMYAEKSGKLITTLQRAEEYEGKKVIAFKPVIENRFGEDKIGSRLGYTFPAESLPLEITQIEANRILELSREADVIGFDEIQFFKGEIINVLKELIRMRKRIIAAGLDRDYLGEPFGCIGEILAIANIRTEAQPPVCSCCKKRYASYSQRFVNGEVDINRSKVIAVEDKKARVEYTPRCIECFVFP